MTKIAISSEQFPLRDIASFQSCQISIDENSDEEIIFSYHMKIETSIKLMKLIAISWVGL
jgi:hypothetical protein